MSGTQLGLPLNEDSEAAELLSIPGVEITLKPHFLPVTQADDFLNTILKETPWRQDHLVFAGKKVLIPRLQAWVGDASSAYGYSGLQLSPLPWNTTLLQIKSLVEAEAKTHFNSVLLNYYRDGHDSVAWHADDEKELGPEPVIASLSLGCSRLFELKQSKQKPALKYQCFLEHGSLLLMGRGLQQNYLHQVPKQKEVTRARVNLTFRKIIL